jgi:hypothetical protein
MGGGLVTEIRINVTPGQRRREHVGRLVVTEVEFDLVPTESAKDSIKFETVEVRPALTGPPSLGSKGWFQRVLSFIRGR